MMLNILTAHLQRHRALYLLAIIVVGAFLRLFRLADLPPGDGYDVAQYGLDALDILDGARPIFLPANFGREPLFSYLVAFVYSVTGPGAFGIHLATALIGIATIPAVYWAARELVAGEEAAVLTWASLLAALVTAVSYWHLNYSRAGLRVIWVPLFAALISAALARGLREGDRRYLALSGLLLGLSLYTYQAARLLPLLVLAGFLYHFVARRCFDRSAAADMLLTFGLALLVFAPLGWFAVQQPEVFNDRLRQTALLAGENGSVDQAKAILEQAGRAVAMFFIRGDDEPLYTIPGRPSLNPFLGLAFMIGLVVAAWRWKQPSWLYLLTWLVLLTAPAMIADQAATAKRALGAFPAVALLIAAGLTVPWAAWRKRDGAASAKWAAALWLVIVSVGLLGTAVITYRDYFFRWGNNSALAGHFQFDHLQAGLAAGAAAAEDLVFISPFDAAHPSIQLNSGRHPNLRSYDGHTCLVIPAVHDSGTRYVIVPGPLERSLERLAQIYPEGEVKQGTMRADRLEPYYYQFDVAAGVEPQTAMLATRPAGFVWGEAIGLRGYNVDVLADEIVVTLVYEALVDGNQNYTAYVQLLGPPNPALDGEIIWGQADSEPCLGAAPTGAWRAGDVILDEVHFAISEEREPGSYQVVTGFYSWPEIIPLPLTEPVGVETAVLAEITIE
jgi:4-amino-4-deoxy-L-arabinose transferase-like glycosyltransferase